MKYLISLILFTSMANAQFVHPDVPTRNTEACVKSSCEILGRYTCDNEHAKRRIVDACSRQLDLSCISNSLNKLSIYEYNDLNEYLGIVRSCQYVQSSAVEVITGQLSSYEQDDLDEVINLNNACYLVNPSCVKDALSMLSRYDKDDAEEVINIASQCQGTYNSYCFKETCKDRGSYGCDDVDEVKEVLRRCVHGPSRVDRRRL